MKKLHILFATLLAAVGLASCDMEKYPYDAVEESQYMKTLLDFQQARIGLYSAYRTVTTGAYVLLPEIQCDDFHAVAGFSNTYGNQYRWDFQAADGNIEAVWANYYTMIARCNFFLNNYDKVVAGEVGSFTENEMLEINTYAAEAYFTRAYSYYMLSTYFCKAYDPNTADSQLGLPIELTYHPTSDASTYPGRSSLKATYEQIWNDLTKASELWNNYYAFSENSTSAIYYLSPYAIVALQARVALQMKDYETAISAAEALISTGQYPLQSSYANFRGIWDADNGYETIWQIYMESPDELGAATGSLFWGSYLANKPDQQIMDYIPSQKLIDLYDQENDIRFAAYFEDYTVSTTTGSSGEAFVFDKYPGNASMNLTVDNHYVNQSKPFRIAEQYLIAAEAYMELNQTTEAAAYLNELRRYRISNYTDETFSNPERLRTAIQDERHKELVGEGFRLADLKRWGLGLDRENAAQQDNLVLNPGSQNTTAMTKTADDMRFVWPIPQSEMDVNPQLEGQQNPGY